MKTLKILLLPVVLVLFVSSVAFAKNINGTWKGYIVFYPDGSFDSPDDYTLTINQIGNKFTGSLKYYTSNVWYGVSGIVNKDKFKFTFSLITKDCERTLKGKGIISNKGNAVAILFTGSDCYGTYRGSGYFEKE